MSKFGPKEPVGIALSNEMNEISHLIFEDGKGAIIVDILGDDTIAIVEYLFVANIDNIDNIFTFVVDVDFRESVQKGSVFNLKILIVKEATYILLL